MLLFLLLLLLLLLLFLAGCERADTDLKIRVQWDRS